MNCIAASAPSIVEEAIAERTAQPITFPPAMIHRQARKLVRSLRRWIWIYDFDEVERARMRQAFGDRLKRAQLLLRGVMDEPAPEDAAEAALAAAEQLLAFAAELEKVRA